MIGDGPIRTGQDEWVVIRNNPRLPKAVIRRLDPGGPREHFRVVTFELKSQDRKLIGRYRSLEAANDAVLYDTPKTNVPPFAGYPEWHDVDLEALARESRHSPAGTTKKPPTTPLRD